MPDEADYWFVGEVPDFPDPKEPFSISMYTDKAGKMHITNHPVKPIEPSATFVCATCKTTQSITERWYNFVCGPGGGVSRVICSSCSSKSRGCAICKKPFDGQAHYWDAPHGIGALCSFCYNKGTGESS